MKKLLKIIVIILQKSSCLSALACRLTKLTGKHADPIHPKHLVNVRQPFFLAFIKKKDMVLDIGCHNGQRTLQAARQCRFIYGLDNNQQALDLAKKETGRLGVKNIEFVLSDANTKLPYKKNQFDAILLLDVFEHLQKRKLVLLEIHQVLKPKGLLFISVPNIDTSWKKLQKSLGLSYYSDPDHKIEFSKNDIIRLLINHQFKIKQLKPVTLDTPFVGIIDLVGGISLSIYKYLSVIRINAALKKPSESIGWEIVCEKN